MKPQYFKSQTNKFLPLNISFPFSRIPQQYYRILCCSHAASPRLVSRKTSVGNSSDVLAGSRWESVYRHRRGRRWSQWWPHGSGSSHTAWSYTDSRLGTVRTVCPTETSGSPAAWQSLSIPLGSTTDKRRNHIYTGMQTVHYVLYWSRIQIFFLKSF